jgi:hypothetical protein
MLDFRSGASTVHIAIMIVLLTNCTAPSQSRTTNSLRRGCGCRPFLGVVSACWSTKRGPKTATTKAKHGQLSAIATPGRANWEGAVGNGRGPFGGSFSAPVG